MGQAAETGERGVPRRVLVLGATGHIGGLVREACRARGLEVRGTSRSGADGTLRFEAPGPGGGGADLELGDELDDAWREADVVVDALDTSRVDPASLALHTLRRGGAFLETSAEPDAYRALLGLAGDPAAEGGAVVLGAGVFPGLSTHLLEDAAGATELEYRARWSVLSGAGGGTVEVMVDALARPSLSFDGAGYVEGPPLSPTVRTHVGGRACNAVPLTIGDVVIAAEPGRSVRFLAATDPQVPRFVLGAVGRFARAGVTGWRPVAAASRLGFSLLRGRLLRRVSTKLTIELHDERGLVASFRTDDAFRAGAAAIAAVARHWPRERTGVRRPHEGVSLDVLASELASGPDPVAFERPRAAPRP